MDSCFFDQLREKGVRWCCSHRDAVTPVAHGRTDDLRRRGSCVVLLSDLFYTAFSRARAATTAVEAGKMQACTRWQTPWKTPWQTPEGESRDPEGVGRDPGGEGRDPEAEDRDPGADGRDPEGEGRPLIL